MSHRRRKERNEKTCVVDSFHIRQANEKYQETGSEGIGSQEFVEVLQHREFTCFQDYANALHSGKSVTAALRTVHTLNGCYAHGGGVYQNQPCSRVSVLTLNLHNIIQDALNTTLLMS